MPFCAACGAEAQPGSGFCTKCGKPLAVAAPNAATGAQPVAPATTIPVAPAEVAAPVAVPIATSPMARKSHTGLWIAIVIVAAIVVVFAIVIGLETIAGPKPEDAVDGARTAYLQHDQANFDKYVDVTSVLSDGTDQGVNEWLRENNTGALGTVVVQTIAAAVKSSYLPSIAQNVDQWVVSGTLTDQPQSADSNATNAWVANFVSSGLRTLAASNLTYQGVASRSVSDTSADLNLNMGTSLSSQPVSVKLRLQKEGDHWRIVAIEDLAGLMAQLKSATR